MKYAVLIGDGMADDPQEEFSGKTFLEHAETPVMDELARDGSLGLVNTIPEGYTPGSSVACMSIFGYDPSVYFSGRGPLEAAGMNVEVKEDEYVFRCNIVTVDRDKDIMKDYSSGHISTEEGRQIIETVDDFFKEEPGFTFYPGVGYRHLMAVKKELIGGVPECTPPHDITEKKYSSHLPKGKGAELLADIMERSFEALRGHPVNAQRTSEGRNPANMVWLWSGGVSPDFTSYRDRFGIGGGAISAVDLVRGIARLAGLSVIDVPGITGYYDTNYRGKADYGIQELERSDIIVIHVEAPDEASHNGDSREKIRAIENFDSFVVAPVYDFITSCGEYCIMVMPDHYTPISIRTHRAGPVPVVMNGTFIEKDNTSCFSEKQAVRGALEVRHGHACVEYMIAHGTKTD